MADIFVARQPIYNRQLNVRAYELLARHNAVDNLNTLPGDRATSSVLVNTFTEIGLDEIVGPHRAFINLTRGFINVDVLKGLPRDRIVLEILEDIPVDESLLQDIRQLRAMGARIALDDFLYNESLAPLVEVADIVKIDIRELDRTGLEDHVETLSRHEHLKLLAEKVETHDELELCRDLGFDYFQGYFFCRPRIIHRKRIPANRLFILRLLSELQDPQTGLDRVEAIISSDVGLSYRLLRYLNSAALMLSHRIESVKRAIVILGIDNIRYWASIIALSSIDDKPDELLKVSLIRARLCQQLAHLEGYDDSDAAFTMGLFSALDAMLDMAMEDIVESLPLSRRIADALLHREGEFGVILGCALDYERGEWEAVAAACARDRELADLYMEAVTWADGLSRDLLSGEPGT